MSENKNVGKSWMAKCNQLTPLPFKGLIEAFNLCKGLTAMSVQSFLVFNTADRTRGHSPRISKQSCLKDITEVFLCQQTCQNME